MTSAVLLRGKIVIEGFWRNIDLLGDKGDENRRWTFVDAQRAAGVTQVAKHQRITEAAMVTTAAPDHRDICIGQRVVAHQLTLIRGRTEQRGDLGFGQLLPSCHSCLLDR